MTFVFSVWYFVIIALIAGIAACLIVFFKMDKKDKVIIEQFVKQSQENVEPTKEENVKVEEEKKSE